MPALRRVNADIYISTDPVVNFLAALIVPAVLCVSSCLHALCCAWPGACLPTLTC